MHYLEHTFPIKELEPEIRERFAFPHPEIRLVVGQSALARDREIFRYAGSVFFSGFEGERSIEVWEILNPDDPFGSMLYRSEKVLQKR
jgi:hypothetical protein